MPFWGIEVKPGKSYTYPIDSAQRKLRLTQASLGIGRSNARATLQINVGDKKPIVLCNLLPNVSENFGMQLEFEESVLFSVLGERSIHLAGYLVHNLDANESDSVGEDIENTESSVSYGDSSDLDKYESDFIDDEEDDVTVLPSLNSAGKELKETSCGNTSHRRLKKAYEVDGSEHCKFEVGSKQGSIFNIESDDTDDSLLASSFQMKKRKGKKSSLKTAIISESEHDGERKESKKKRKEKKKKNKKGKDAVEPHKNEHDDESSDNPQLVSEAAIRSGDGVAGKKKRKAKNKDESHPALVSEAAEHRSLAASDTTQQNATDVDKKKRKRSKSDVVPEL